MKLIQKVIVSALNTVKSDDKLTIVQIPLITESNDTFLARSRDDFLLGLLVNHRQLASDELILDIFLDVLNFLAFMGPNLQHTIIEPFEINLGRKYSDEPLSF